jgi:hypothetical protein
MKSFQVGFLDHMVVPLFNVWLRLVPDMRQVISANIKHNKV